MKIELVVFDMAGTTVRDDDAVMRRTGVSSARSVAKVGDTPSDLQEGTAAGCGLVIGVTIGTHTRAQLAPHSHTRLIDSLDELPALLF